MSKERQRKLIERVRRAHARLHSLPTLAAELAEERRSALNDLVAEVGSVGEAARRLGWPLPTAYRVLAGDRTSRRKERRRSDRGGVMLSALAGLVGLAGLMTVGVPRVQGWVAEQQLRQALELVAASGPWPSTGAALADAVATDDPELGRVRAYVSPDSLTLATRAGGRVELESREGHRASGPAQAKEPVTGDQVVDGLASGDAEEPHHAPEVEELTQMAPPRRRTVDEEGGAPTELSRLVLAGTGEGAFGHERRAERLDSGVDGTRHLGASYSLICQDLSRASLQGDGGMGTARRQGRVRPGAPAAQ
jgi:hypothetical protein